MKDYISDTPRIIVAGFVRSGITGALDHYYGKNDDHNATDSSEVDTDEDAGAE